MVVPDLNKTRQGGIMLLVLEIAAFILGLIIRYMSEEDIIIETMDHFNIDHDWAQEIFDWVS